MVDKYIERNWLKQQMLDLFQIAGFSVLLYH